MEDGRTNAGQTDPADASQHVSAQPRADDRTDRAAPNRRRQPDRPDRDPPARPDVAIQRVKFIRSFGYAFEGIGYLFRTQRNARIEVTIAAAVCALAAWLGISRQDWAILALTIAFVLAAEALNTAIEVAVDLSTPQRHPLAKIAKDVAAGMVLIAAGGSVVVGLFLLGPLLWHRLVK
jgi:diacylglycerol kinase